MSNAAHPVVAEGLSHTYQSESGAPPVHVLDRVSLRAATGEMLAVVGPSGSGKSTLLYCLSGLEAFDAGNVLLFGRDLASLSRKDATLLRRDMLGFVFQSYNLVPGLTAEENVTLPARLARRRGLDALGKDALNTVGLSGRERRRPSQLSGGEQQRVAIARVLATSPSVIFADEPTGALDAASGALILDELRARANNGATVILVTHDLEAAARADRVLVMRDGRISAELASPTVQQLLDALLSSQSESE